MNPVKEIERMLGADTFDYMQEADKDNASCCAKITKSYVTVYGVKLPLYKAEYKHIETPKKLDMAPKVNQGEHIFENEKKAYAWLARQLPLIKLKDF